MATSNPDITFSTVREQIRQARIVNTDGKWFMTTESIAKCLPRQVLVDLLAQVLQPWGIKEATNIIDSGGRRVFMALILMKEETHITKFIERQNVARGTLDSQLPFSKTLLESFLPRVVAREFEEEQWNFVVPIFRRQVFHQRFERRVRLPFLKSRRLGNGGSSHVYETIIAAGYHDFDGVDSSKTFRVVRKELEGDNAWEKIGHNEHTVNAYLQHLDHPNILPLLAAYTQNGTTSFILPFTPEGDLDSFLNSRYRPDGFLQDLDFYEGLHGLASALQSLHGFRLEDLNMSLIGYHHDIKPKNILIQHGRFILADFGLSKFKDGSNSKSPFKIGQGHYLAPECEDADDNHKKGVIGRSSDIWSLGCIMLEVVIFMANGPVSLATFRQRRKFQVGIWTTATFFQGKAINGEVIAKLDELLAASTSLLLRKIISLISRILVINPEERPKAEEIAARLRLFSLEHASTTIIQALQDIVSNERVPGLSTALTDFLNLVNQVKFDDDAAPVNTNGTAVFEVLTGGAKSNRLLSDIRKIIDSAKAISGSDASTGNSLALDLDQLNRNLSTILSCESTAAETRPPPESIVKIIKSDDWILKRRCHYACVSDDDAMVAFTTTKTTYVYNMRESGEVMTLPYGAHGPESAKFSPCGRFLLVVNSTYGDVVRRRVIALRLKGEGPKYQRLFDHVFEHNKNWWPSNARSIRLVAIAPDSSKIAVVVIANSPTRPHHLIVAKGPSGGDEMELLKVPCSKQDRIFCFSPDSCRLAFSTGRSEFVDGRHTVLIKLLRIAAAGDGEHDAEPELISLDCDEELAPRASKFQDAYNPVLAYYEHLLFRVWNDRWVVGIWAASKRELVFWDIASRQEVKRLSLFCFAEEPDRVLKNTSFSEGIAASEIAATTPTSRAMWPFRKRVPVGAEQKRSIIFANMDKNEAWSILQDEGYEDYWMSCSGRYVATCMREGSSQCIKIFDVSRSQNGGNPTQQRRL